jgi:hypothetical protein
MEKNKPTRKGSPPIKVYCLPDERNAIEANARATGTSLSSYLLNVGMGYQVRSIVDNQQVEELARINGDLGRLGGLLKLWLTNDRLTAQFGEETIRAVLARIEETQDQMISAMTTLIRPRSRASKSTTTPEATP